MTIGDGPNAEILVHASEIQDNSLFIQNGPIAMPCYPHPSTMSKKPNNQDCPQFVSL